MKQLLVVFQCVEPYLSCALLYRSLSGNLGPKPTKQTHRHNRLRLSGVWILSWTTLPGWAGTKRKIHQLTPILIINHPLSASYIYCDPSHPVQFMWQSFCTISPTNQLSKHTHTHTQPFYCWSGICPGPPGSAGTRKVKPRRLKPIWIYWSKR